MPGSSLEWLCKAAIPTRRQMRNQLISREVPMESIRVPDDTVTMTGSGSRGPLDTQPCQCTTGTSMSLSEPANGSNHIFYWSQVRDQYTNSLSSAVRSLVEACTANELTIFLDDAGSGVVLDEAVILRRKNFSLRIVGQHTDAALTDHPERTTVTSSAHSVFQTYGKHNVLYVENLNIKHTCQRPLAKEIGGCVFAMNQSKVTISNCSLTSEHGFCCWSVHRSQITLNQCTLSSKERSGCVVFGESSVIATECLFEQCKIHGLCCRGDTSAILRKCQISYCGHRALYIYGGAIASLVDCTVDSTISAHHAALDVWISRIEPLLRQVSLTIHNSIIRDNAGAAIRLLFNAPDSASRENILFMEGCTFANNGSDTDVAEMVLASPLADSEATSEDSSADIGLQNGLENDDIGKIEYLGSNSYLRKKRPSVQWYFEVDTIDRSTATDMHTQVVPSSFWRPYSEHENSFIESKYQEHLRDLKVNSSHNLAPITAVEQDNQAPHEDTSESSDICHARYSCRLPNSQYCIDFKRFQQTNVESFIMRAVKRLVS